MEVVEVLDAFEVVVELVRDIGEEVLDVDGDMDVDKMWWMWMIPD